MAEHDQTRLLAEHAARLKKIYAKHKAGRKLTTEELTVLGAEPEAEPKLEVYDSINSAAAATGIPKPTLQRWKRQGCPAFRNSRVYGEELELYRQAQGESATEPHALDKGSWDALRSKQNYEREQWEFARDRGEYTSNKVFAENLMALGSEQKALLRQKLENEFPALIPGLEPEQRAEVKKLCRQLVDELCRRHQRLVDQWK